LPKGQCLFTKSPNIKFGISTKKIKAKYYIWLSIKPKRIAYNLPYVSYTNRWQQAEKK
tara:strand:+ start:1086 stop:1259 length:174 start_codon:yes stop_codon:yes gene_type:complete